MTMTARSKRHKIYSLSAFDNCSGDSLTGAKSASRGCAMQTIVAKKAATLFSQFWFLG